MIMSNILTHLTHQGLEYDSPVGGIHISLNVEPQIERYAAKRQSQQRWTHQSYGALLVSVVWCKVAIKLSPGCFKAVFLTTNAN